MSREPRRYQLSPSCTRRCTLNPDNQPGTMGVLLHGWFEAGDNNQQIIHKASALGRKLTNGAVGRHRANHLVRWDPGWDATSPTTEGGEEKPRKSDLDILDQIIGRGAEQIDLATMRISAEQLLRAIELKQKLTQGAIFADFYEAIGAAGDEIASGQPETPDAAAGAEEQAQQAVEDGG